MSCGSCGRLPAVPYVRVGLPTVWAWGPFPDHEVVDYTEIDNGLLQQEQES
jgi:hypothetical protein